MITNRNVSGNSKAYKTQPKLSLSKKMHKLFTTHGPHDAQKQVTRKTKQHTSHATLLQPKCQMAANYKNTIFADPQMTKSKSNVLPNTCHVISHQMSEFRSQGMHITDLGKVPDD